MEIAITKISQNGQVVIPAEVRKDAGIKPKTKFIVYNKGGNILLKQINNEIGDVKLVEKIHKSEGDIKKGKVIKADTSMNDEEIDNLLTA
jgi:AbrB family looped-hinge helix DNA binding protein|tara:strand:- start:7888 stop:8157 length:270 start_codon:yes stop_codon:yes gene_type:complete